MIALIIGGICLSTVTVTVVTDAALVTKDENNLVKQHETNTDFSPIFLKLDSEPISDAGTVNILKTEIKEVDTTDDAGAPTYWFECGQSTDSQKYGGSNEHYTISTTKMTALEGYNYCADLVQYPDISDPGILYTNTEAIDFCMYETLKEFSNLWRQDTSGDSPPGGYPISAYLGGYYNDQVDDPAWRWANGDEIPPKGNSSGYENWKEYNSGPQDRCILGATINPDQSGKPTNGSFEADYGWYTVDCSIKQYVVCKDCALGYYFLNGCYRNCTIDDAPYDYWEITCEDDANEWNCKFGLPNEDDDDLSWADIYNSRIYGNDDFYGNENENSEMYGSYGFGVGTDFPVTDLPTTANVTTPASTGDYHNCMRFGQDWDVTRNGTLNFSNRNISYVSYYSFSGLDVTKPVYLKLSNNRIGEDTNGILPSGIFNGMTDIRELWLDHNLLERLNPGEFAFQKKARFLTLEYNLLSGIPSDTFNGMKQLQTLRLSNNLLTSDFGIDSDSLKELYLDNNALTQWPRFELILNQYSLMSLEILNISNNYIYKFEDSQFTGMTAIKTIDASCNEIQHIGDQDFYGTANSPIERLNLAYNKITRVTNKAFRYFKADNWEVIDLHGNLLENIAMDAFYSYSENGKNYGPKFITYLDLSENMFESVVSNLFQNTKSLKYINLSGNMIQSLPSSVFANLNDLKFLDLSGNSINYMNVNLFSSLPNVVYLNLDENECTYAPAQCGGTPAPTFILQTCHCN